MKVLVIGYGLIGAQRVAALDRAAAVTEIAVYDPALELGRQLTTKARSLDKAGALAAKYDAAIVAAPHDATVEVLPAVFPLAPYVLVEKPLGRTAQEARQLIAAAERAGSHVNVGFNYRYLKNVRHLKELIDQGDLGRILGIDGVLAHGAEPGYEKSWKTVRERCGGGVCIDPGVHLFDLLGSLFGDVQLVAGALSRTYWQTDVEDHASLTLSVAGGALAQLLLSITSWQSRFELTFEFENAQVMLQGRGRYYGPQSLALVTKWSWLSPKKAREQAWSYGTEDGSLQEETLEFVETACGRDPGNAATSVDGLRSIEIVDACYRDLKLFASDRIPAKQ